MSRAPAFVLSFALAFVVGGFLLVRFFTPEGTKPCLFSVDGKLVAGLCVSFGRAK